MKTFTCQWDSLETSLDRLGVRTRVLILRCLKETAIRDQNYTAAGFIRAREKCFTGGVSNLNNPARKPKKKA